MGAEAKIKDNKKVVDELSDYFYLMHVALQMFKFLYN